MIELERPSTTRRFNDKRKHYQQIEEQLPDINDPVLHGLIKKVLFNQDFLKKENNFLKRILKIILADHSGRIRNLEKYHDQDFKMAVGFFNIKPPKDTDALAELIEGRGV